MARTALVTGAGGGLGRAVSAWLHELGYRVVVTARDEQVASAVAASLGERAGGVELDVTSPESIEWARQRVGPVDILVHLAGVLLDRGERPSSVAVDRVEEEVRVNVLGPWRVSQAFLPGMLERGWGRIVMVSSGTGAFSNGLYVGAPGYSLSKAALNALTVLLAGELEGTGILVNAVNPGRVRTRMCPDAATSPKAGAGDIVWAATLPDDGPTGQFLRHRRAAPW